MNKKTDIEVLFPGKTITIAGEEILITPFKLTQIPEVAKLVAKYVRGADSESALDVPKMIEEAGEDVFSMMCVATGKSRQWLDDLSGADGMDLLSAIIEENADFFIRKVTPQMTALGKRLTDGLKSSKSSSSTDTDSVISETTP